MATRTRIFIVDYVSNQPRLEQWKEDHTFSWGDDESAPLMGLDNK
jgi:hypothetical protein